MNRTDIKPDEIRISTNCFTRGFAHVQTHIYITRGKIKCERPLTSSICMVCISLCMGGHENVCFCTPSIISQNGWWKVYNSPLTFELWTHSNLSHSLTHRHTLTLTFAIADTNIHQISSYQTVEPPHTGCLKQQNVTQRDCHGTNLYSISHYRLLIQNLVRVIYDSRAPWYNTMMWW